MSTAMERQEDALHAVQPTEQQRVRRRAPGRFDLAPRFIIEPIDVVDTRAADDSDDRLDHRAPGRLIVMTGVVAAVCVYWQLDPVDTDGRVKPGHDVGAGVRAEADGSVNIRPDLALHRIGQS